MLIKAEAKHYDIAFSGHFDDYRDEIVEHLESMRRRSIETAHVQADAVEQLPKSIGLEETDAERIDLATVNGKWIGEYELPDLTAAEVRSLDDD